MPLVRPVRNSCCALPGPLHSHTPPSPTVVSSDHRCPLTYTQPCFDSARSFGSTMPPPSHQVEAVLRSADTCGAGQADQDVRVSVTPVFQAGLAEAACNRGSVTAQLNSHLDNSAVCFVTAEHSPTGQHPDAVQHSVGLVIHSSYDTAFAAGCYCYGVARAGTCMKHTGTCGVWAGTAGWAVLTRLDCVCDPCAPLTAKKLPWLSTAAPSMSFPKSRQASWPRTTCAKLPINNNANALCRHVIWTFLRGDSRSAGMAICFVDNANREPGQVSCVLHYIKIGKQASHWGPCHWNVTVHMVKGV